MTTFQPSKRIILSSLAAVALVFAIGPIAGCSKAEEEPKVTAPTDNNSEAAKNAEGAPPVTNAPPPGKWPGGG